MAIKLGLYVWDTEKLANGRFRGWLTDTAGRTVAGGIGKRESDAQQNALETTDDEGARAHLKQNKYPDQHTE